MKVLNKSIVGLALALFAFLLLYIGPKAMVVWLLLAATVGLNEYYEAQRSKGVRPLPYLGIPVAWLFIILALISIYTKHKTYGPQNFAVIVSFYVIGVLVYQFFYAARGLKPISTVDVSVTLFGSIYVGGLLSYLLLIWDLGIRYFPDNLFKANLAVFLPLWAAYGSDSTAFLAGSLLGKRKIFPLVSPNKTIVGSAGALGGCILGILIAGRMINLPFIPLIIAGMLASAASQTGDFCESVFKREHDIKDSGAFFGSHGGFLDRMDSLLFALPVVYYFLYWFPPQK